MSHGYIHTCMLWVQQIISYLYLYLWSKEHGKTKAQKLVQSWLMAKLQESAYLHRKSKEENKENVIRGDIQSDSINTD